MKHKITAYLLAAALVAGGAIPAHAAEVHSFEAVFAGNPTTAPTELDRENREPGPSAQREEQAEPSSTPSWVPPQKEEIDPAALAREVLERTNTEREKAGLPALETDPVLTEMAMLRAKELEERYSHTRPDGENCKTVFDEFETGLRFHGENAAKGHKSPEAVVQAWMDSTGHRENLLRDGAEYLGVGVWQDEDGILYWVQLFGKE